MTSCYCIFVLMCIPKKSLNYVTSTHLYLAPRLSYGRQVKKICSGRFLSEKSEHDLSPSLYTHNPSAVLAETDGRTARRHWRPIMTNLPISQPFSWCLNCVLRRQAQHAQGAVTPPNTPRWTRGEEFRGGCGCEPQCAAAVYATLAGGEERGLMVIILVRSLI